jgi:hypothetical protein
MMRQLATLCLFLSVLFLQGCKDDMIPVDVVGYNHTEEGILGFTVNGAEGPNMGPHGGGGAFNCCINIPRHWKPGMKVEVDWEYGSGDDHPAPPPQTAMVEIPEYTPESLGNIQVHFYPGHKVIVISSFCGLGHPWYPMPQKYWAPWTLDEAGARYWAWYIQQGKFEGDPQKAEAWAKKQQQSDMPIWQGKEWK